MRYFYISLALLFIGLKGLGQTNYDVSLIPKDLLSHARAVIRNSETTVDIKDLNNVIYHYKYAITILNKNADNLASLAIDHDKIHSIRYIKGSIYDEFGKLSGKIAERDFEDQNAADGYSLFLGDMIKNFRPSVTAYPYTIEYDYEVNAKETLFLEDWSPQYANGTSVEHSSYKLTCKPDFKIRYKEINYPGKIATDVVQGFNTYTWQISNIKALRYEPFSPDDDKLLTSVKLAPEKFSYDGVTGAFTNWTEYGAFIYDKLLKDRRALPQSTIDHIKEITASVTDPKQKAKIVYEYMQQKTRYVSVQIGIGGYRPFLASDVDGSGYGDCKALVNYTQSLLSVAGIDSYYVLVMAGRDEKASALADFASMNQFDHVILCIPFKNDTTWLECTSQQIPFGFLSDFTDDRNVVACTPEGGKLLHTPVYTAADNKQIREATFTLDGAGQLTGEMVTRFEGTQYDNREYLVKEPLKEQVKMLKEVYPIENLDIQTFELKQDKAIKPTTTETLKLQARDYMAQNGGRYFFIPNIGSKYIKPIKDVINRANPVYINRGYHDEDEITYALPDNYRTATEPLNIVLDKPFGRYTASTTVTGNKLIYKRTLQINQGTYPTDSYTDLVDFYQSVYEADRYTMTMEKK
jgi:hypothetical protein